MVFKRETDDWDKAKDVYLTLDSLIKGNQELNSFEQLF